MFLQNGEETANDTRDLRDERPFKRLQTENEVQTNGNSLVKTKGSPAQ